MNMPAIKFSGVYNLKMIRKPDSFPYNKTRKDYPADMTDAQIDEFLQQTAEHSLMMDVTGFVVDPNNRRTIIDAQYHQLKYPVYLNDDATGKHASNFQKEYESASNADHEALKQKKKHPGNTHKVALKYAAMAQKTINLHYEFVKQGFTSFIPYIQYDKSKLP